MPRTAEQVAAELYEEPRDLLRHEQEFLAAVHRITMTRARILGEAVRGYGDRSPLYDTIKWTADHDCARHLARALERYDAAVSAMDQGDEAEFAAEMEFA
jgi:hypothetical protein